MNPISNTIMHFPFYLHFDWLLAYGQFVIALKSHVMPADNSSLHVDIVDIVDIVKCYSLRFNCLFIRVYERTYIVCR